MLLEAQDSALMLIDIQQKLQPLVHNAKQLIKNCLWLKQLAETLQVPILITEQYPKGLGKTVPELDNNDLGLAKTTFSAYRDACIQDSLVKFSKKQWVLAGMETSVCVLQTAIDMKRAGFDVYVVADSVSARHLADHQLALERMRAQNIQITTKEMVLFEWVKDASHPAFKSLSLSHLRSVS